MTFLQEDRACLVHRLEDESDNLDSLWVALADLDGQSLMILLSEDGKIEHV